MKRLLTGLLCVVLAVTDIMPAGIVAAREMVPRQNNVIVAGDNKTQKTEKESESIDQDIQIFEENTVVEEISEECVITESVLETVSEESTILEESTIIEESVPREENSVTEESTVPEESVEETEGDCFTQDSEESEIVEESAEFAENEATTGEYIVEGSEYKLLYSIEDNTVTITGVDGSLSEDFVIPSEIDGLPVKKIGARAFDNELNSSIQANVTIPDSVTEIGEGAFMSCPGIETLTIGKSVTMIGNEAFSLCWGMKGELIIPDSVMTIGNDAFRQCQGLTGIHLGKNLTTIGGFAFQLCEGFSGTLILPDSLTEIGRQAFDGCDGFTGDLTIPDSVTVIGNNAFECDGLDGSLIIGDGITEIHSNMFPNGFTGSLVIGDGVKTIGESAFSSKKFSGTLSIGNSVEEIGQSAFYNCPFTGDLTIPDSVTQIGQSAFSSCGFTGSLVIGDGLTEITSSAFSSYNFTGSLVIGDGIKSIERGMFPDGFTGSLTIGNGVKTIGEDTFQRGKFTGTLAFGSSVEEIGNNAFYDCAGFTGDLVIPDSVTIIGRSAFSGCTGFQGALKIGKNVSQIGDYAFVGCTGFTGDLIISDSVTQIGESAFRNCTGFTGSLYIGNGLTEISSSMFPDGFTGSLTIGDGVKTISSGFAKKFTGSLTIGKSVEEIGSNAFLNGSFTGNLVIPDSVTAIGESAFRGCSGFTGALTIPGGVTKIGKSAFRGCSGFTGDLTIPDSVSEIGESVFYDCSGFNGSLNIGKGMTQIAPSTFLGCSGLTGDLVIPEGVTKIGYDAFKECSRLCNIELPASLQEVGNNAFYWDRAVVKTFSILSDTVVFASNCLGVSIIYGHSDSTAAEYAKKNEGECVFIPLGETPSITEYKVSTMSELRDAIGSYRRIILADGVYYGFIAIDHEIDLSIEAEHSGKAEILAPDGYPVVDIKISKGIQISGCILGHDTVTADGCPADIPVGNIYGSFDVEIKDCDLYGCGVWGVTCRSSWNVAVCDSIVRDCKEGIANGSVEKDMLRFYNCILSGNAYDENWTNGHNHTAILCKGAFVENCMFLNNYNTKRNVTDTVIAESCTFYNNAWDGETPQAYGICVNGITWQVDGNILRLGYSLQLDETTSWESKKGVVLDYSKSSLPWRRYNITETDMAEGILDKDDPNNPNNPNDPDDPVPHINVSKQKTAYVCGELLNIDDLTVQYYDIDGAVTAITEYTTNAAEIDMSVPGIKILIITYNELTAEIRLIVTEKNTDNTYTVIFDTQDHGTAPEVYTNVEKGSKISAPQPPVAEGFLFTGWYKESDCKTQWDFDNDTVESDIILYAGWKLNNGSDDDPPQDTIPDGIWIKPIDEYTYTGNAVVPAVTVYYNKKKLIAGRDYTIAYQNNTKAAQASAVKAPTVIVKGKGNYAGTKKVAFTINKARLTEQDLKAAKIYPAGVKYTPIVSVDGNVLKTGTDYKLVYLDSNGIVLKKQPTKIGSYQMRITGKGSCEGEFTFLYRISESECATLINKGIATVSNITYGSKEPQTTLSVLGKKLERGVDYIVTYANIHKKGTATATFIGIGNYTGTLKKNFKVQAAVLQQDNVKIAEKVPYEKGGTKAAVAITVNGTELVLGTDFTVSYRKNTKLGSAFVTIKGKGNYTGTITKPFQIESKVITTDNIKIFVSDVTAGKKPTITIYDINGKKLSANSDYKAEIDKTAHQVTISGGKNGLYKTESPIIIPYQELEKGKQINAIALNKKSNTLPKYFEYTGREVVLDKDWLIVKAGKTILKSDEFEILGYVNNIEKGTATVIIKGCKEYGGIRMFQFKIKAKGLL